ncbi:Chromatin assembly factor 1 subunit [Malassezia psittaci]|uniref:Chromatin assembly factor 1 subunit n=1 Tax=Malassezia psittaci TaxID=1821823 RepID=A0AAF0F7G1_9BASI|nr:Chromatin assembly factor 1 subunit [Malassezia psittaci]
MANPEITEESKPVPVRDLKSLFERKSVSDPPSLITQASGRVGTLSCTDSSVEKNNDRGAQYTKPSSSKTKRSFITSEAGHIQSKDGTHGSAEQSRKPVIGPKPTRGSKAGQSSRTASDSAASLSQAAKQLDLPDDEGMRTSELHISDPSPLISVASTDIEGQHARDISVDKQQGQGTMQTTSSSLPSHSPFQNAPEKTDEPKRSVSRNRQTDGIDSLRRLFDTDDKGGAAQISTTSLTPKDSGASVKAKPLKPNKPSQLAKRPAPVIPQKKPDVPARPFATIIPSGNFVTVPTLSSAQSSDEENSKRNELQNGCQMASLSQPRESDRDASLKKVTRRAAPNVPTRTCNEMEPNLDLDSDIKALYVECFESIADPHSDPPIARPASPIAPTRLAKILDHNLGQAVGLPPGRALAGEGSEATTETHALVLAGGASWRLATAGGDNNVRIWIIHPQIPSPAALAAAGQAAAHPPRAEYAATLSRHTGVVNVVRFSPHGDVIASAGDDGVVLFWVRRDLQRPGFGEDQASGDPQLQYEKEAWRVRLLSRASSQELYDMAWSKNGDALVVGGTDFAARIINPADGSVIREIADHQHYVQGVAWDPLNEFIATQSSDRAVHIYTILRAQNEAFRNAKLASRNSTVDSTEPIEKLKDSNSSLKQPETIKSIQSAETKSVTPHEEAQNSDESRSESDPSLSTVLPKIKPADSARIKSLHGSKPPPTTSRLYGDDRYSSFFRRLAFSPDGALLATPTGIFATSGSDQQPSNTSSAVYLYARGNFRQSHSPIAALPGHKTATIATAFSPILYQLRTSDDQGKTGEATASEETGKSRSTTSDDPPQLFKLPYRMVYAVATQESVWVYDTQQSTPICCLSNLHYASFTDLTWSPDGQVLMMSSTDGYCSIAIFDYNELGQPYHYALQPSLQRLNRQEASIPQNVHVNANKNPSSQAASKEEPPASILPKSSTDSSSTKAQGSVQLASQDHNDIPNPASTSPPSSSAQPKKKRRVALTFEGPLPP